MHSGQVHVYTDQYKTNDLVRHKKRFIKKSMHHYFHTYELDGCGLEHSPGQRPSSSPWTRWILKAFYITISTWIWYTTPHKNFKHASAFDGNSSIIPNIDTLYHLIFQAYSIVQSNGYILYYIAIRPNFTVQLLKSQIH